MRTPIWMNPELWDAFLAAWTDQDGRIRCIVQRWTALVRYFRPILSWSGLTE